MEEKSASIACVTKKEISKALYVLKKASEKFATLTIVHASEYNDGLDRCEEIKRRLRSAEKLVKAAPSNCTITTQLNPCTNKKKRIMCKSFRRYKRGLKLHNGRTRRKTFSAKDWEDPHLPKFQPELAH